MDFFISYKNSSIERLKIQTDDVCLDVGWGIGTDVKSMALRIGPQGKVVGIDVNEDAIRTAKIRNENPSVEYYLANGGKITI